MCVQHRYKGKISLQGRGKLWRLVLVYDTYTVSRNVMKKPSYADQFTAFLLRVTVWRRKLLLSVLITKGLQIIGHCNLLDETVYCMLFAFIAGAVTKDAETQTELTMNDMILFEQSVITSSERENPDGEAVRLWLLIQIENKFHQLINWIFTNFTFTVPDFLGEVLVPPSTCMDSALPRI